MNKQALREAMVAEGMIREAAPSLPRPRRNTRAGDKFRAKVKDWMRADIQAKMEQAGVPQKKIQDMISYDSSSLPRTIGWRQFDDISQEDLIGWLEGKWTPSGPVGYGSARTYPQIIKQMGAQYGGASSAARDQALSISNKLSTDQKALACAAMFYDVEINGTQARSDAARRLMKELDERSGDTVSSMLPILQWAAKCPSKTPNIDW